jgi:hypothetical protein
VERDRSLALRVVSDADTADYAEWPAWLPFAVDLLVEGRDDAPLQSALDALADPVAPKTSPYVTAQIERLEAHLAARAGEADSAIAHWRSAHRIMSDAHVVFDAAVLALELGEHSPDDAAARALAAGTFDRLRARRWQERAARIKAI